MTQSGVIPFLMADLYLTSPSQRCLQRWRSRNHGKSLLSKDTNVEWCSWQTVLSSHEGCKLQSCVVVAGDHLHICGGSLEDEAVIKPDRFDPIVNKWEEIANMQQERRGTFWCWF